MALTPEGSPYVEASDLVADYPATSLALANRVDLVGVLPFATSAARATAIPSPTDGQFTYLQDTNSTEFYNGSAFQALAGGKILQVIRATDVTERTTTSTSYVDVTGMTVTITPTKNTSYLFIIATFLGGNNAGLQGLRLTTSGATPLSGAEDFSNGANVSPSNFRNPIVLWGYNAPATTSAVTYKLQQKLVSGTGTLAVVQNQNATGQMYAIEVGA